MFEYWFIYTAYADYKKFFMKDAQSIKNLVEVFNAFYLVSGLKRNFNKI